MYRVKANGNFNLIISDINVSIPATQLDGILVEKEKFDASGDAQKLLNAKLIVVEDAKSGKKQTQPTAKQKGDKAFVVEHNEDKKAENVFVREPDFKSSAVAVENVAATNATLEVKEVTNQNNNEVKAEVEVVETEKVEATTKTTEAETKVVEAAATDTKRNVNKKVNQQKK